VSPGSRRPRANNMRRAAATDRRSPRLKPSVPARSDFGAVDVATIEPPRGGGGFLVGVSCPRMLAVALDVHMDGGFQSRQKSHLYACRLAGGPRPRSSSVALDWSVQAAGISVCFIVAGLSRTSLPERHIQSTMFGRRRRSVRPGRQQFGAGFPAGPRGRKRAAGGRENPAWPTKFPARSWRGSSGRLHFSGLKGPPLPLCRERGARSVSMARSRERWGARNNERKGGAGSSSSFQTRAVVDRAWVGKIEHGYGRADNRPGALNKPGPWGGRRDRRKKWRLAPASRSDALWRGGAELF